MHSQAEDATADKGEIRDCLFNPLCTESDKAKHDCGRCKNSKTFTFIEFWGACYCYQLPPAIPMP